MEGGYGMGDRGGGVCYGRAAFVVLLQSTLKDLNLSLYGTGPCTICSVVELTLKFYCDKSV